MKNYTLKNSQEYTIREISIKDTQDFLNYREKVATESSFLRISKGEGQINLDTQLKIIQDFQTLNNHHCIVAEFNNKIIGNLVFRGGLQKKTFHIGSFGITVLKEYWNNKIAFNLLTVLLCWINAPSNIISKINLEVRTDNHSAIKLYKKFEFQIEGKITRSYLIEKIYYDSYNMGLEINK